MFRVSFDSLLLAPSALLWSAAVSAQTPPAPPAADEDLEVPASATPATPSDAVRAPAAPELPAASPPAASATPPVSAPAPPAAAPAARVVPATPAPATPAPASPAPASPVPAVAAEAEGPVNLERRAHTRPVASGLHIGGYLHAQYLHSDLSEDQLQQGGSPINQDQFMLRRARLRVDRGWQYVAGTLELDASTVSGARVGIRRAEGSLLYRGENNAQSPPLVMLSVGVLDLPFGFELAESARVRWFMERTLGSSALFPTEMDLGAKLSGAVSFVRYAVAVSNGEPLDDHGFPRDPNESKDVTGRFGAEIPLGEVLELSGGSSFAVGKGFHAGRDAAKSSVAWNDVNEDGIAQPTELIGLPGSAATPSENFERWAIGLDVQARLRTRLGDSHLYAEAFVASNYDRGFAPSDPVVTSIDARQAGGYVALTQELTRYGVVGFRAAIYDPNSDVIETRAGRPLPKTQTVKTLSPLAGLVLPNRARLLFQYDFVRDYLARDAVGVPSDADNDQWTLRLQVEL